MGKILRVTFLKKSPLMQGYPSADKSNIYEYEFSEAVRAVLRYWLPDEVVEFAESG